MGSFHKQWSRRKLLATSAGAAALGLAGCSSDAGQDSSAGANGAGATGGQANDSSGSSGGSAGSNTFAYALGRSPTEVQFNEYNAANWAGTLGMQMFQRVASGRSDGTIKSNFLEEFSVNGKKITLKLPEGFKWWNGNDLTGEDYHTKLELNRLQNPKESPVKSNTLVDDYTIEMEYKEQLTPYLMKAPLAGEFINTPRWVYQEHLENLQDASTQKEREQAFENLSTMQIPAQRIVDDGLGTGPFKLVSFNSSRSLYEKDTNHPYSDRTSIENVEIHPDIGSNIKSLVSSNGLDMQPNTLINQNSKSYFPSGLENVFRYNWFRMQKFTFNWKNKHLNKRPVRRAIMNAVDLNPIVQAMRQAGTVGTTVESQTGIRPSIYSKYLGEGWADQLIDYPVEKDVDSATALMEQAGYSKQNDSWVDGNGDSISFSILTQNAPNQVQATKVFNDQLSDFGIQAEISSVDSTDYYQQLQSYDDDIYWIWHVDVALWHPIAYFSNTFYGVLAGDPSGGSDRGPTGVPFSLDIPQEVGATNLDGGSQTIQPVELMNSLQTATSSEEVQEATRTLCQWFNFDLPGIVFVKEDAGYWGDTQNYSFPDGSDHPLDFNVPGLAAINNGWVDTA